MHEIAYAAAALVAYVVISLIVGERFPFSRYLMYAALKDRSEGAVLYLRAGDRFLEPEQIQALWGMDVEALDPTRVPCSQQWIVYEVQRLLNARTTSEPPAKGTQVEAGYRMLRVLPDGQIEETLRPVSEGTATIAS